MTLEPGLILDVLGIVALGGVAWGGSRAGASSVSKDLESLETKFDKHCETDSKMAERLVRVETLIQAVHGKVVLQRREADHEPGL